jgi:hypothetical protein
MSKKIEQLFYVRPQGIKYSSAPTRYAGLHDFMQGAEINEVNVAPSMAPGEIPTDWNALNIKSGVNRNDCPSAFGMNPDKGMQKIGNVTFMPDAIVAAWRRIKGEPLG